jgi:leucyl-tRNA synthetase
MATGDVKSRTKVVQLLEQERKIQERWAREKVFEEDAPAARQPKYFTTFPYPYMNGRLHLGHTFSLSKCEFAVGYWRLQGRKCLFPFGFHCTGMPIKTCADKLAREMEQFGTPPVFPLDEDVTSGDAERGNEPDIVDKAKGKKTKAVAKTGPGKYQWQIMQSLGLSDAEIARFANPAYWLQYFPPLAIADLKAMGVKVDWRRSFLTTDINPYYDSFVRWQFLRLREKEKVKFGKRYTIFSPKDGQPCMDHDRQTGEGVGPQEYTMIKLKIEEPYPACISKLAQKSAVYLTAGTLRPETMYGQTNCWVSPDITYIAFSATTGSNTEKHNGGEVWIATRRAARNMAHQGLTPTADRFEVLLELNGSALMGATLSAPLAAYSKIHALPMLTIKESKGTGIVTSVPSDSPDDFAALRDLKQKKALREKYGITDNMVMPFEPVPIIDVPGYGKMAAATVCEELKIQSQNDREKLQEAKEKVYLKGFYEGVMAVGEHSGRRVQDVKKDIQRKLIDARHAVIYMEPERQILSRSGDECVVALCDQWYLNYGEAEWKKDALSCLGRMQTFGADARNNFLATLDWLHEHACARSYGLGTKVPWDEQYLVESLSDSTIYMAYYTVCHLLHADIEGSKTGVLGIRPDQMTPEVWDYVFSRSKTAEPALQTTDISVDSLNALRREFDFWYPMDVRCSGKDLIQNHLTYMIYNHTAIWPTAPSRWPLGARANGHLQLNNEKMSKSTGNFLTLRGAIEKYSADGMRLALADSGDGIEDANFVEKMADAGLLRLYNFVEWSREVVGTLGKLRNGPRDLFVDRVFENAMNKAIAETGTNYEKMLFKEAIRTGFFELQSARDAYRELSMDRMHSDLVARFLEVQALLLAPVCPHVAETVWTFLGKQESIMRASWPRAGRVDDSLVKAGLYLSDAVHDFRILLKNVQHPKAKKAIPMRPNRGTIYVAQSYPSWQAKTLQLLQTLYEESGVLPENKDISRKLAECGEAELKKNMKKLMPFVQAVKENFASRGRSALDLRSAIDETAILKENLPYLISTLELQDIQVRPSTEGSEKLQEDCAPGKPFIIFEETRSALVTAVNPQVYSGLFEFALPVLDGDSMEALSARVARHIRKSGQNVQLWRYNSPKLGLREIPNVTDMFRGKTQMKPGVELELRVDEDTKHVTVEQHGGSSVELGSQVIYVTV